MVCGDRCAPVILPPGQAQLAHETVADFRHERRAVRVSCLVSGRSFDLHQFHDRLIDVWVRHQATKVPLSKSGRRATAMRNAHAWACPPPPMLSASGMTL